MRPVLRYLFAALVIVLVAAGAYTAFWFHSAELVRDGFAAWTSARRAEGYAVAYAGPEITGYPWHLRIRLDRIALAAPGGRWRWAADAVEAKLMAWAFRRITVRPLGRQTLAYPGADGSETAAATATDAKGVILLRDRGRLEEAHCTAEGLVLALPRAPRPLTAERARLELAVLPPSPQPASSSGARGAAPNIGNSVPAPGSEAQGASPSIGSPGPAPGTDAPPPPSAELSLRLDGVTLPQAQPGPLGPHVQWLTAEAVLDGSVRPDGPAKALAAWRDEGGAVEIRRLELAWGPLLLSGNATLALDGNMQPEGAGTANIRGYGETIDALVAQGLMKPQAGTLTKAALGLMAKTPADGGAKVLTVPLSIQNRVLYAGPIGLLKLPTIVWAE